VLIPKPGGGERPLGIPTLKDRVVQTAAKLILEPIFEADLSEADKRDGGPVDLRAVVAR
jgi:RNA-directed DNA polymerase